MINSASIINNIIGIATIIMIIVYVISLIVLYIKFRKDKITNEDKRITNELYKLYLEVNPEEFRKKVDDLIDFYMSEYVIYHFNQDKLYIRSDQTEEMIRTITETTYINLSDLYVFYIKMIINVKTEEDILGYINNRVKTRTILYVSEVNKNK